MTPYAALRSATATMGQYLHAKDRFGTVTTGSRADLILLEANPLTDVAAVAKRAGVMVRGRWLPEAEIQAGLQRIAVSR
jgi:imidazolonepropionase-like amidohydrolase